MRVNWKTINHMGQGSGKKMDGSKAMLLKGNGKMAVLMGKQSNIGMEIVMNMR